MVELQLEANAVPYAVRIARRLRMGEREIRTMVEACQSPIPSVEFLSPSLVTLPDGEESHADAHRWIAGISPTAARIIAVVRTYESLTAWGRDRESALGEIKRHAGTHLDPRVVGEFLSVIREADVASIVRFHGGESWGGTAA